MMGPGFWHLMLCIVLASGVAVGQESDLAGKVDATSLVALPAAKGVTLNAPDESVVSSRFSAAFEHELSRRGYSVESDAPLALSFEWRGPFGAERKTRRNPVQLRGETGSASKSEVEVMVDVLNVPLSRQGQESRKRQVRRERQTFVLEATLADADGRELWKARAEGLARPSDERLMARSMVNALIARLGKTVTGEPFP